MLDVLSRDIDATNEHREQAKPPDCFRLVLPTLKCREHIEAPRLDNASLHKNRPRRQAGVKQQLKQVGEECNVRAGSATRTNDRKQPLVLTPSDEPSRQVPLSSFL